MGQNLTESSEDYKLIMSSITRTRCFLGVCRNLDAGDEGQGADQEGVQPCHQGPLGHGDGGEVTGQEENIFLNQMEIFIFYPKYPYYCHMARRESLFPHCIFSGSCG